MVTGRRSGELTLTLRCRVGGKERTLPLLGQQLRIGRGGDNDLVLPDPAVSRRHAALSPGRKGWRIVDEGSTNGIFLNGKAVREGWIAAGDQLQIGPFELRVEPGPLATAGGDPVPAATILRPLAEFAPGLGLESDILAGAAGHTDQTPAAAPAPPDRHFLFLSRLAGQLLTAASVGDVLERTLDAVFAAMPVERGFVLLPDEGGEPRCELARHGELVERRPAGEVPVSRSILKAVMEDKVALVTLDAQADERFDTGESILLHDIRSALCAPLWSGEKVTGFLQADTPYRTDAFDEADLDFLTAVANYAAVALERLDFARRAEREAELRTRLERYHSPSVIEAVLADERVVAAGARHLEPAEATVLFADLVGFSSFAEEASPEDVAQRLSGFFDIAVEAIFSAGGTLDKYIGDCVMAFFGPPTGMADHARRGLEAARAIRRGLAAWNRDHPDTVPLAARVALNSGPVVVGDVGSSTRVDYTVLGNAVNVAARLEEQVARPGDVVLGEATWRLAGGAANDAEDLGDQPLRGLQQAVRVFRLGEAESAGDTVVEEVVTQVRQTGEEKGEDG